MLLTQKCQKSKIAIDGPFQGSLRENSKTSTHFFKYRNIYFVMKVELNPARKPNGRSLGYSAGYQYVTLK